MNPDGEATRASVPSVHLDEARFAGSGQHAVVAVVIVTYNSASDVPQLIDDLRCAARDVPMRVIIVDNQSSDDTVGVAGAHDDIIVVDSGGNLGYAGGINAGLRYVGGADGILILNPDLGLAPAAIERLLEAAAGDRVGAVVPLMFDADGAVSFSLCFEPSIIRAFVSALVGSKIRLRPHVASEFDFHPGCYREPHDIDWATGAALLIPADVVRQVGEWNEDFFLYSEEVDFFRRIRMSGRRIRFEPSAVVKHRGAGSGMSPALADLKAVNRIRYVELYHGRAYSTLFRLAVALGEGLRSYDPVHRGSFFVVLNRRRWHQLPQAVKPIPPHNLSGPHRRGTVIVPAYNEAPVIKRTLDPLSSAAADGFIELIVVCNGCTDGTAEVARSVPAVKVLELEVGSKPAALNAGDAAATQWPRLYLDADVQITAESVIGVLDRLAADDVLAASPDSRYDSHGATAVVRSYYRAKDRIAGHKSTLWSAGAYGMNLRGHARLGRFPSITGDDLYVDSLFDENEKVIVPTEPSVRKTPADARSLLSILRRHHRGVSELATVGDGAEPPVRDTGLATAIAVITTVRSPRSAVDAFVYLAMALAARRRSRRSEGWERDESTRATESATGA
jgi:GT2 family glycosyltransferase